MCVYVFVPMCKVRKFLCSQIKIEESHNIRFGFLLQVRGSVLVLCSNLCFEFLRPVIVEIIFLTLYGSVFTFIFNIMIYSGLECNSLARMFAQYTKALCPIPVLCNPGIVAHTYNLSTQMVEAGELGIQCHPCSHSKLKTCSKYMRPCH